jgi:hypothetical protein
MRLECTSAALSLAMVASGCFLPRGVQSGDGGPERRDSGRDARALDAPDCVPTTPAAEVCDGVDNDCDPGTADGAAEMVGLGCDGTDADNCEDGIWLCDGTQIECSDDAATRVELCDGDDNDCNNATADGSQDPRLTTAPEPCDGADTDFCVEGVFTTCVSGALAGCSDSTTNSSDLDCEETDGDCDGRIDEGAGDCCTRIARPGEGTYLFCRRLRFWEDAVTYCGLEASALLRIDDRAEHDWIAANAPGPTDWWIAMNDLDDEMTWEWEGWGTPEPRVDDGYRNWNDGEPSSTGEQDCGEARAGQTGMGPDNVVGGGDDTTDYGWNDDNCFNPQFFICEPPLDP